MYKCDLHIHTATVSKCASITPLQIINNYKEKGFSTIFITDHCYTGYFKDATINDWPKICDYLYKGYEECKIIGDKNGLIVLPGIEITQSDHLWDYLIYGITKDVMLKYPLIYDMSLSDLKKLCDDNGYLFIQAHPRRDIQTIVETKYVHGLEVFNGQDSEEMANETYQIATAHDLLMTSGSDCHELSHVGIAGISSVDLIDSVDALKKVLESKKYTIIGHNFK